LIRFGARHYDEIDRTDIELWRQEMETAKFSKALIRNRIQYIKAIYNYAKKETKAAYRISYNPAQGFNLKSGDERKFCLIPEKFERNYEYFKNGDPAKGYEGNPDFGFFYLGAWECFRRPEEVANYRLEYIDWDTHIINVPSDIAKTKNGDAFPLTDRLWNEITARYHKGEAGLIFRNESGTPWIYHSNGTKHTLINNVKRHMRTLREKFGKDAGWFRDTRGGGITNMFRLGADAKVIMGLSGHHDIRSVMRYNKNFIERMREANALRGQREPDPQAQSSILPFKRKIA
jgi:integrase